jgi:hypothetical protein
MGNISPLRSNTFGSSSDVDAHTGDDPPYPPVAAVDTDRPRARALPPPPPPRIPRLVPAVTNPFAVVAQKIATASRRRAVDMKRRAAKGSRVLTQR